MGASSVTGTGPGMAETPRYVNLNNPRVSELVITNVNNGEQQVVLTGNDDGELLANGKAVVDNMCVLAKMWSRATPERYFVKHVDWHGGGILIAPASSHYYGCDCCSGCYGCSCDCICWGSHCSCGCGGVNSYYLVCVNPEQMTWLETDSHYLFVEFDVSKLTNIEWLELENIRNTNFSISNLDGLYWFEMGYSKITGEFEISNNSELDYVYMRHLEIDESKTNIEFETLLSLSNFGFTNCNLSSSFADQLLVNLADSLSINLRTGGWVDLENNNGVTSASEEARARLVANSWNVLY